MTSLTRHTQLEPVSPDNAVLLFVDQQEGWFSRIHEPQQTAGNVLALARSAGHSEPPLGAREPATTTSRREQSYLPQRHQMPTAGASAVL